MTNPSELNEAIFEAHESLEKIDNFDLNSNDANSVSQFDALEKAHNEAVKRVVLLARDSNV